MFDEPVNPEAFLLARKYANSIQVTVKDQQWRLFDERLVSGLPEELRFVLSFA